MSELERYKSALNYIRTIVVFSRQTADTVESILNPPPEMETVETEHWHVFNKGARCFNADTERECKAWMDACFDKASMQIVRLTGSYQRVKPMPVEQVWTLENAVLMGDGEHFCKWVRIAPFPDDAPTNKTGTLTFTWAE